MGKAPSSSTENLGLKKGPWTAEEDQKLVDYVHKHGHTKWQTVAKNSGLKRCGKSCRLRWTNYLRPDIKRGKFSTEEEETIIQLHGVLGNKWSMIATHLPGRTDNEIKNYWNTHIRKKLLAMGIDPVTHNPRLDLLLLYSFFNTSMSNANFDDIQKLFGAQLSTKPNILNIVNSLASSQYQTRQRILENPVLNSMLLNQFKSFQANQLHTEIHDLQACTPSTNSSAGLLNDNTTGFLQANMEEFSTYTGQTSACATEVGYIEDNKSSPVDQLQSENQMIQSEYAENFGFGSVISSTPTSSMTFINCSIEDKDDTYCSNLDFDFQDNLDFGGFL